MDKLSKYAQEGRIDMLYDLLQKNKDILDYVNGQPFWDTPLHLSASYGQTLFSLELLLLKPSFGTKLNSSGLSPLHVSIQKGHFTTSRKLAKHYPELVRVKGRGGITPLHQMAMTENVDVLAEFLQLSPLGIHDVTAKGETVVHVAVVNKNVAALRVLVGWMQRIDKQRILGLEDDDGNTALHVAVSTSQTEVVKLLTRYLNVNAKNIDGQTSLDITMTLSGIENEEIKKILVCRGGLKASETPKWPTEAAFLSSYRRVIGETLLGVDVYMNTGLTSDMRNALLVVAGLIVTSTYQAILQPPGGYERHRGSLPNASNIRFAMTTKFSAQFLSLNTLAFFTATLMLDLLLPLTRFNLVLKLSLSFLGMSYIFCAFSAISSAPLYVIFPFVMATLLVNIPLYVRTTSSAAAGQVFSNHQQLQFLVMSRSILKRCPAFGVEWSSSRPDGIRTLIC
ncbi:homeodomain transcription factor [Lithospermum erythrorhizon]|uniref:Homeodomain transcription factor n=1 Tax=Lithospermum erythrorhizon TaxID=34254 RepID=A0AAV3NPK8_LITER